MMPRIRPSCRKPAQSAAEQRGCTESRYPVALFGQMWWAGQVTDLDRNALLAAYDAQLRAHSPEPVPEGVTIERDGPLVRTTGLDHGGFLSYTTLGGLAGDELDALIARQRDLFAARGESVEWKLHGHDEPADLPERLRSAGFEPEPQETVVVGPVAPLAATMPVPPEGVRLREVSARADLDRIVEMEEAVWNDTRGWLAVGLERELAADPQALSVVVAEADNEVVSAGWVRYVAGTGFATLWGGSTLPRWRKRGIYKALVTYRARLAAQRGYTYLQVDASDDSRPILQRLGFIAITTTTPYVFTP
jgi:GNAT superfamily N-acetyltransferase